VEVEVVVVVVVVVVVEELPVDEVLIVEKLLVVDNVEELIVEEVDSVDSAELLFKPVIAIVTVELLVKFSRKTGVLLGSVLRETDLFSRVGELDSELVEVLVLPAS